MPEFKDLPDDFACPYRNGCPYLEGLSTRWVFRRYQEVSGTECHYEYQLEELHKQLDQEREQRQQVELENQQIRAQFQALHRRQFQGRKAAAAPVTDCPSVQRKKRGAPVGHPPWQRPKPKHIDRVVALPAPQRCPHCQSQRLQPLEQTHDHVQEDIVLEPRTVVTCFRHHQARCPACDKNVWRPGPGELPGAYIGPAAKATAAYLRHQFNVSDRKISQFFGDFFGLKFVPASAYGFERQAARRGLPLYEDRRQKIRALPVVHADETSWRHDGNPYWVRYAGDDDLAFFQFDAHRSGAAAQSVLGKKLTGILVSDAYAAYDSVGSKDWQSCLAHLKRKAKELDQELALLKGKTADPPARRFCQKVQNLIHRACRTHHRLSRRPWRAKTARRHQRALVQELAALCRSALRYEPAEAFRKRLNGPERKHLFTFLRYKNVPPTNNQAERSLRPVVIMRKIIQCTRSPKGLENHSVLRSLLETARRQGRKPHQFFLDLFLKDTVQAQAALYRRDPRGNPRPPLRC